MAGSHGPVTWWRDPFGEFLAKNPGENHLSRDMRHKFITYWHSLNPTTNDLLLRSAVEALAIAMLAPDAALKQAVREDGWELLTSVDYSLVRTSGALACVESAYWRGVEAGLFPQG